jgi:NAD(P)-dependent dehydrogenase (short-subunit alcohol dehydrogenase family)
MRRFEGRRVLITAGASGLGLGMALRLAEESAAVTVWDRDAEALTEIEKAGHDLRNVCLDMTSAQDIEAAVAEMGKAGQIDVLVNNIGGSLHTPFRFLEQSEEDWERVMDVNITACVRTSATYGEGGLWPRDQYGLEGGAVWEFVCRCKLCGLERGDSGLQSPDRTGVWPVWYHLQHALSGGSPDPAGGAPSR